MTILDLPFVLNSCMEYLLQLSRFVDLYRYCCVHMCVSNKCTFWICDLTVFAYMYELSYIA